jgi:hypothetical protein
MPEDIIIKPCGIDATETKAYHLVDHSFPIRALISEEGNIIAAWHCRIHISEAAADQMIAAENIRIIEVINYISLLALSVEKRWSPNLLKELKLSEGDYA